ncbi:MULTISPECIES: VOC family protein [Paenibacillus]|uniref:VOC family protein n=1 Tax=Paenibacillus TaxID=44249 RepID=UPI0022B90193|nr:VOC family protein [Paenibacillus caseinilyticus]MCZ8521472.1 VOC family protein [Paenibacillus caseinilyticus]
MNVTGFNHLTIRVESLSRSLPFYEDVLGMKRIHLGRTDAYLAWGAAWICLVERPLQEGMPHAGAYGMDHAAFTIDGADFPQAVDTLRRAGVPIVRGPIERGGGFSVNFLDPDGTQLELFTGSLQERMKAWS